MAIDPRTGKEIKRVVAGVSSTGDSSQPTINGMIANTARQAIGGKLFADRNPTPSIYRPGSPTVAAQNRQGTTLGDVASRTPTGRMATTLNNTTLGQAASRTPTGQAVNAAGRGVASIRQGLSAKMGRLTDKEMQKYGGSPEGKPAASAFPGGDYIRDIPNQVRTAYNEGGMPASIGQAPRSVLGAIPAMAVGAYESNPVQATGRAIKGAGIGAYEAGRTFLTGNSSPSPSNVAIDAAPPVTQLATPPSAAPVSADPRQDGDPRFEAMRNGTSGRGSIGANRVFGEDARTGATVTKDVSQGIGNNVPFGQRSARGVSGGSIRDEQTGETISMGPNGVINRFDANGQAIAKLSDRNWGNSANQGMRRPGLESRQPGQQVNYKSREGLTAEFGPGWNNNDIRNFTDSIKGGEDRRAAADKQAREQAAARAAMNGGRGPGPARPVRPNISGMAPREANTVMDGYRADLASYDNAQQNFTAGMNNDTQNRITEERYKVMGIGDMADGEAKQLGLERTRAISELEKQIADADPNTPEGQATIAEAQRRYQVMNPPKEKTDQRPISMNETDEMGNITGQYLVDWQGNRVGEQQQGPAPAPVNEKERVIGQTYMTPDGRIVTWTKDGWSLAE